MYQIFADKRYISGRSHSAQRGQQAGVAIVGCDMPFSARSCWRIRHSVFWKTASMRSCLATWRARTYARVYWRDTCMAAIDSAGKESPSLFGWLKLCR